MTYVLVLLVGAFGAAVPIYLITAAKRREMDELKRHLTREAEEIKGRGQEIDSRANGLQAQEARLQKDRAVLDQRLISYDELQGENLILKRDLQNVDVHLRKLQLDGQVQAEAQEALSRRSNEVSARYLKDTTKLIGDALTPNNFASCKQRLQKVIGACREIGYMISSENESALLGDLKAEYERVVKASLEREEQSRIKARIREEQLLEKEIERETKQLERERAAIQAALVKALAEAKDQHTAEIDGLKARLAEAEERQRALSQAQLTKAGHVYVISNIGSFGEGMFKVGMTRRLEPRDRVRELGDASVPFPFDVHMMISSKDAPHLELELHKALHKQRVNKANPRKEFFQADVETIRRIVEQHHGEVQYVADAEALEFRQSQTMTNEDLEFIESVYDQAEDDGQVIDDT